MSFRSLMNKKMNVRRRTRTTDGAGGFTYAYSNVYTSIPCRIQPMSGREQAIYGMEDKSIPTHNIFTLGKYTGITTDTEITVGSRIFDVTMVRNIDEMGHHLEIEAREPKT